MKGCVWLSAASSTLCTEHHASTAHPINAFIPCLVATGRCASRRSRRSPAPSVLPLSATPVSTASLPSSAGDRFKVMTMAMEKGRGGGEVWCEHHLLNTVTTEWVEDNLGNPEVALVDIRGRVIKQRDEGSNFFSTAYEGLRADYLDAHIPGAVFVDWTEDIAETGDDGVAAQLTDRETFVPAMEERGVGGAKRVVVYDNGDMLFATRFWWAMRRFGHDRVAVMDGGWSKWQAERRDITPDCPCPLKVYTEWAIPPERERPWLVATASDVRAALGTKSEGDDGKSGDAAATAVQLLDARAAVQFTGEVRRARRGGHIPGAVNTPYRSFLTEGVGPDGTFRVFKDLDGIKEVFEAATVDTSPSAPPVIAYCNGGVASTVALFLLFQLRQIEGGGQHHEGGDDAAAAAVGAAAGGGGLRAAGSWANYDGSWNEWGNDETTPVER